MIITVTTEREEGEEEAEKKRLGLKAISLFLPVLLHVQKSPSKWIRGIGLRCSPLICQITVNLPRHRMKS